MPARKVSSFRISEHTAEQLAQLSDKLSLDRTDTIMLAIDRMYQSEFPQETKIMNYDRFPRPTEGKCTVFTEALPRYPLSIENVGTWYRHDGTDSHTQEADTMLAVELPGPRYFEINVWRYPRGRGFRYQVENVFEIDEDGDLVENSRLPDFYIK